MNSLEEAVVNKLVWKGPLMDRYARALLLAALDLAARGKTYFNNDDVEEAAQPGDKTTVGTAIKLLINEKIITPFRGNIPDLEVWGGMRRSSRACNNGHRNQLYTLTNAGIAREWLRRHGGAPAWNRQDDFLSELSD